MIVPRAIIAPLVGGIIGYITNDLAIRMLFRPRKALYIGRFHIPFTPGLIPSQQGRIAQSIGDVISSQLLNEDTLRQTLLSEGTVDMLRSKVRTALRVLSKDERRISDLLRHPSVQAKINMSVDEIQEKLTVALSARIVDAKLGYAVVDSAIGNSMDFITQNKLFSMLVDEKAKEGIRDNPGRRPVGGDDLRYHEARAEGHRLSRRLAGLPHGLCQPAAVRPPARGGLSICVILYSIQDIYYFALPARFFALFLSA